MNRQSGDQHWSRQHPERVARGPAHGRAKLTPEQVAELCARFECQDRPMQTRIAKQFGISRYTVRRHLKAAGLLPR